MATRSLNVTALSMTFPPRPKSTDSFTRKAAKNWRIGPLEP
jgi:hypothetical protein